MVITEAWELKAYLEVIFNRQIDFDNLDEFEAEKLFFQFELIKNERDFDLAKMAFLHTIGGNKEIKKPTKNKAGQYGAFNPDELLSIMRGYDPKKRTLSKTIDGYLESIGALESDKL